MHKREEATTGKSQEEDPDLQDLIVTHDSINTKAAHFLAAENKSKFEHALKGKFHQSVFGLSHASEVQVRAGAHAAEMHDKGWQEMRRVFSIPTEICADEAGKVRRVSPYRSPDDLLQIHISDNMSKLKGDVLTIQTVSPDASGCC
eukprot:753824-Hanusia_phi.AAC.2